MPSPFKDDQQRDEFLASPRLAILMTNNQGHSPIGVPVWFEWTGSMVQMFAANTSPKLGRIKRDPNASVLVTNAVGESEAWVAFDGRIEISDHGGIELASRLAERYWDLENPQLRALLSSWEQAPEAFCLLTLTPEKIRMGQ